MRSCALGAGGALAFLLPASVAAHEGPPFPIVSDHRVGAYVLSVWTDPDTTDDGSPGGQFWIMLAPGDREIPLPVTTTATVVVRPIGRPGPDLSAAAAPVRGRPGHQFAAVVMDHEGRFAVTVRVAGPLGAAEVAAEVDATYDRRPPPYLLAVYLAPFALVGLLWGRLLMRRRGARRVWTPRPRVSD